MKLENLSVVITTFNEEVHITETLRGIADWAADIVVVDSFSTDKTLEILNSFTEIRTFKRIYTSPSDQKNWGINQIKTAWTLLIDADERVTPELKAEIENILTQPHADEKPPFDAYQIGFIHFFMGKRVRYSGWQNDKTIRLIRTDVCRYNTKMVHEEIETQGLKIGRLENKFLHFTFKNATHFWEKQQRYARWSAQDYAAKTGKITAFHWALKPFFRFFKHFVLKLGFLDGFVGFVISATAAWSVFQRYVFIQEMRQTQGRK
jgi:glycosyltransferase involved in cell wall biosynthesis